MSVTEPLGKFPFAGPLGKTEIDKVHSDLFGGVWAPETLPDLMHILVDAVGRTDSMGGWRGQSQIDWRIDSGALRRIHEFRYRGSDDDEDGEGRLELPESLQDIDPDQRRQASVQLEKALVQYETTLIDEARLVGHGFFGGRELSDLELLAVLQHHGAATRLLDLSKNVFVALYFACADHPNDYGLLVGFDTKITGNVTTEADLRKPIQRLLRESRGNSMTWAPRHLFERMRVQQSFFIFSQVTLSRWGSLALTGPEEPDAASASHSDLTVVAIPPALKSDGARMRARGLFGYDGKSLFPDLEGFSRFSGTAWDFEAR